MTTEAANIQQITARGKTTMAAIVAPKETVVGDKVEISVTVTNNAAFVQYVHVGGGYNGNAIKFHVADLDYDISQINIQPRESRAFRGVLPLPLVGKVSLVIGVFTWEAEKEQWLSESTREVYITVLSEEDALDKKLREFERKQSGQTETVSSLEPPRPEIAKDMPLVLSMEEYARTWKPKGWNLIIIGPTSTWRTEWGEWEAIRDIVQNALDEPESYQYGYDDRGLWIADKGRGVAVADFLLGPPKLKPDWARGKYGEGMKIAALALIRKGYPVHVETVGRELWIIFLEQMVETKVQTLAALWKSGGVSRGTKFHIIGYRGSAYAENFAVNLPRTDILAEGPSILNEPFQRYNQLIKTKEGEKSRIYARDIYVRDIDSPFSYNLWGFDMAPDRHGPKKESDMWIDVGRLWACVTKPELLEQFYKMTSMPPRIKAEESQRINMGGWDMGKVPSSNKTYVETIQGNARLWRAAWHTVHGEAAVIRTNDRWDSIVKHLGYNSVSINYNVQDAIAKVMQTDMEIVKTSQERLREAQIIPDSHLMKKQLDNLRLARAIAEKVTHFSPVKGVHAALIPPASDRVRTAGMYGRTSQEIFIAADQLNRAKSAIDCVIHEIAHHTSGSEDLEERHAAEMTSVAATVVQLVATGEFDNYLKGVAW